MNKNYFTGFDSMLEDDNLAYVMEDFAENLPHGSGIDCDWSGHMSANGKYVYFRNSYHCMDENGFYEGWQDFALRIPKIDFINFDTLSIIDEFTVQFNGGHYLADKHMLKEYLDDLFAYALRDYFNSLV